MRFDNFNFSNRVNHIASQRDRRFRSVEGNGGDVRVYEKGKRNGMRWQLAQPHGLDGGVRDNCFGRPIELEQNEMICLRWSQTFKRSAVISANHKGLIAVRPVVAGGEASGQAGRGQPTRSSHTLVINESI
jgi:hypothetical protein